MRIVEVDVSEKERYMKVFGSDRDIAMVERLAAIGNQEEDSPERELARWCFNRLNQFSHEIRELEERLAAFN